MEKTFDELRAEVLVSPDELATQFDSASMVVIDARKGDAYRSSHIPGAVALTASPFLRQDGDVINAEAFATLMSDTGIGNHTPLVVYDDGNSLFATRLWWVAQLYGHRNIKVLDGGWDLWLQEGHPTSNTPTRLPGSRFSVRRDEHLIASTEYVQETMGHDGHVLLDVRGAEEWTRTESSATATAGHIPGAGHVVWSAVLDPLTKRFKSGAQLADLFAAAGATTAKEIIPYCLGGIRAAHTMLALHLAGYPDIRNYEGSWAAWTHSAMPIEAYQP